MASGHVNRSRAASMAVSSRSYADEASAGQQVGNAKSFKMNNLISEQNP
jgi:hypothetical protein